ncbi:tautomerase family protein, partial [Enterobacter hormaechei]
MGKFNIICFQGNITEKKNTGVAADIAETIVRHLNSKDRSISVALHEVQE